MDRDLLERVYQECDGWIQRVKEKLAEEEGLPIQYSTLTRMLRELGISQKSGTRCERVADQPGAEMQADTSLYPIVLAGQRQRLIASMIYLRYSKRRYLKFYRVFRRFTMKCFLHEALLFWGYAAPLCIIDNTNLARWRGTGKNAVMVPEMEAFAKQYGFRFCCHEKGHANRKAGEERSFYTVETNFFPGRQFADLEDLNRQAREWCTVRWEHRVVAKTGLIPAQAFEQERGCLVPLSPYLPAPYQIHERGTDQYGYAALDGNYYWVPGTKREDVKVLEYGDGLKIYLDKKCVVEYRLPVDGGKNQRFSPEGMPAPRYQPNNCKKPSQEEEKRLRALSPLVEEYLDFIFREGGLQRHRWIRELFALRNRMTDSLFVQTIQRALHYRITCLATLERIARLYMTQGVAPLPCADVDETFQGRQAYREGSLTDTPDFSLYDQMLEVPAPGTGSATEDEEENDG